MKAILLLVAALMFAGAPLVFPSFGGFDPDRFPIPQREPPIQPAAYAFSIWGLIYLWLLVHAGFGLLKRDEVPAWDAPRWPLMVSMVLGAVWLGVARHSPLWAFVIIVAMLAGALVALFRVPPQTDRWLLQAPIAIYAGWLTAATGVSLGLVGAGYGLVFGQMVWTLLALLVTLGGAAFVQVNRPGAPEYGLTVIWALIAVIVQNGTADWAVSGLALIGILVMALAAWTAHNDAAARPAGGRI
jgi:hypothetical protein